MASENTEDGGYDSSKDTSNVHYSDKLIAANRFWQVITQEELDFLKKRHSFLDIEDLPSKPGEKLGKYVDPAQTKYSQETRLLTSSGSLIIYTPAGDFPSRIQLSVTGDPTLLELESLKQHRSQGHYIQGVKEAFVLAMTQGWRGVHLLDGEDGCLRLAWVLAEVLDVPCPDFKVLPKDKVVLKRLEKYLHREFSELFPSMKGPVPSAEG
jgi:hypothetical protein